MSDCLVVLLSDVENWIARLGSATTRALWVRAEAEDREEALRRSQEEKETNNPSRSAFLQCGLIIPVPGTSVESGLQQKVEELQKILDLKNWSTLFPRTSKQPRLADDH